MLLKLLFRNTFRSRLRSALTISGVAIAVLAFGLLRTVVDAWYAGADATSATRLVTRNAISLIFPLPISYIEKIRSIDNVKTVSYGIWFGGRYIDEKHFFANFAVEPRSYLQLYPEFVLPEEQKEAFFRNRKGCIAGRKLAERFGWRIGDNITLQGTIYPGNWDLTLLGIYKGREPTTDERQFFLHWDYPNETLKKLGLPRADQVGFYMIGIEDPDRAAATAEAIDGLFKNSYAETLTETEKAFSLGFIAMGEAILTAIQLVSLVVIVIIMAVVANTMAMSVRERSGEYAVFKTLGFGRFFLGRLILGESLLITGLGGLLGILLTFPVADIFAGAVADYFPAFFIKPGTLLLDGIAVLVVGLAASVIPIWRTSSARITDALGRVG